MVQLCPHPKCTASYDLDDGDEGKTFRCEACNSLLLFEAGVLTVISSEKADDPPRSLSLNTGKTTMLSAVASDRSLPAIIFSWFLAFLFALGSFLIVLFFFLPLIDQ